MGRDGLGQLRDLIDALDDAHVELVEVAECGGVTGADHFPDLLAFRDIHVDAAFEAFNCVLLELADAHARFLGVGDSGKQFDEFVHAVLDSGVEFHDVLSPFGEALLALGDMGFQIGDGGLAGLDIDGFFGYLNFLGGQTTEWQQDRHASD